MKSTTFLQMLALAVFGFGIFLIDRLFTPGFGMGPSSGLAAVLILALLGVSRVLSSKETDEREHMLQLEADGAALYVVIAGLLAATIFYPHSEFAMVFWSVCALAVVGRITAFLYQRYK